VGHPDFKSGEGRKTALGGFDSCLLRHRHHAWDGARRSGHDRRSYTTGWDAIFLPILPVPFDL
jgi:hypothetical protein